MKKIDKLIRVAEGYIANEDAYIRHFVVVINGKRRKLATYANSENGNALRELHTYMASFIRRLYQQSNASFAYAKGKNIIDCIKVHIRSDVFLKTDIHSYFNSITFEGAERVLNRHKTYQKNSDSMGILLKACFYNGRLPLGFVSSPVISDIFLVALDRKYSKRKDILYTRYADDFIISARGENSVSVLDEVRETLSDDLGKQGLFLNTKKTYIRTLKQAGDAIHLLGVNLVKTENEENRITVSDRYIRETSKGFSDLMNFNGDIEEKTELCNTVCGQISFIQMCSQDSLNKLQKMVRVKCGYSGSLQAKAICRACGLEK
ncbi:MAG: hypothetical protein IJO36_01375 [Clostridia bacterium]|nr:hypothetical protein [Clostridia bacterium]